MLVYANALWFDGFCSFDDQVKSITQWLNRVTRNRFGPTFFKQYKNLDLGEGRHIQSWITMTEYPHLYALRYTHPDRDIQGRQWVTEIGLRRESDGDHIRCTVVVRTEEMSARIDQSIQVTRPGVIAELVNSCPLVQETYNGSVIPMDMDLAETLNHWIDDEKRIHPLVIISPTPAGTYLLNDERLSSLLVGLAYVICIPVNFDTYRLSRTVGEQYAPWHGAVSIIFPTRRIFDRLLAYGKKLLPNQLEDIPADMNKRESEVLSILTHYSNSSISRQHISPEVVQEVTVRRELRRRREVAFKTGEQSEYISLLEEENTGLDKQIKGLETKLREAEDRSDSLELALEEKEDEKRTLQYDKDSLVAQLASAESRKAQVYGDSTSEKLKDPLANLGAGRATPKECLAIVSCLYPTRIFVLDTAWKSADDSVTFRETAKAFDLLWKMVNDYWEKMTNGKGDIEAGKVFGNAFAARESETVENNSTARNLRTFEYNGEQILMMRHLKLGNKDSAAETLRIHFYWDSERRIIVIGHCGPHLNFR